MRRFEGSKVANLVKIKLIMDANHPGLMLAWHSSKFSNGIRHLSYSSI